jgi:hypothetical protein
LTVDDGSSANFSFSITGGGALFQLRQDAGSGGNIAPADILSQRRSNDSINFVHRAISIDYKIVFL